MEVHDKDERHVDPSSGDKVRLDQQVEAIRSRQEFICFVQALSGLARQNTPGWENRDLPSYLDALAGWVEDMDGYYQNRGEPVPERPDWKVLGQILLAATVYE